jgi:hypothetical protein
MDAHTDRLQLRYALGIAFFFLSAVAAAQPPRAVVFLRPAIRYDDIKSGTWVNFGSIAGPSAQSKPIPQDSVQYERLLLNAARSAVAAAGANADAPLDNSLTPARETLESLSSRLARGSVNDEAVQALAGFAAADERNTVLAQFLHVQTGPGNAWNPYTGAIASSASSTLLQCALLEAKTGKVLWKGEQLVRYKALRPTDSNFGKVLRELYKDFNIR